MCLNPRLIKNPKYKPNKKNGGIAPVPNDKRVTVVPVGCQQCIECRKQKAREWTIRLAEEIRTNTNGKYVTLTFNQQSLDELEIETILNTKKGETIPTGYALKNAIATYAVRKYLERWRKKHGKSVRHWLITELGTTRTERIHLHGIIFTDKITDISERWGYGGVTIGERLFINGKSMNNRTLGYVNEETIGYIVKYMHKTDIKHKEYVPKILTSSGIGAQYTATTKSTYNGFKKDGKTNETYTTRTGHKLALPVYYRNKIYTEEEREKLWIEKIEKKERWVLGEKIDISNGEATYFKMLKIAQEKNKRMGYGQGKDEWKEREYTNIRRLAEIQTKSPPPPENGGD